MHQLPKLPYPYEALEPYLDEPTMRLHHTKHHQSYIDKFNLALEPFTELHQKSLEGLLSDTKALPEVARQAIINHGGGHYNHSFFWRVMTPASQSLVPTQGEFARTVKDYFGGFDGLKTQFIEKAMSVFGSGWAFLIIDKDKRLALKRHSFQNTPLSDGKIPLLCVDLWEHAYYLKYQNRRDDYLQAWWQVINWHQVEENFNQILQA